MKVSVKILGIIVLFLFSCQNKKEVENLQAVDYVNTLVGTLSEYSLSSGNTYPAIARPWGMNFWTPQTRKMGDGWTYTYTDHKIKGFKQTHQPSPWINDYGQYSIMPVADYTKYTEQERESYFSHKTEVAKPYYYSVYLADQDVKVDLSTTERAAIFNFRYPESQKSGIVIDAFDRASYISYNKETKLLEGFSTKNSGGVPSNFKNYFIVKLNKEVTNVKIVDLDEKGNILKEKNLGSNDNIVALEGQHIMAILSFTTHKGENFSLITASSFISKQQAKINLKEVLGKSFEQIKEEGRKEWNKVLSKIKVSGGTTEQKKTFYSNLYRSLLFPRKFYEIDEEGKIKHYSPYNGQICEGYLYTDTGFWDTFRALFPLLNLVYPYVNKEIQEGLVNISKENAFLPEWASPGHRDCMVGNNSASVVADAIIKEVNTKGIEQLYKTLVYATENVHKEVHSSGRLGYEYYNTLGFIPYDVGINENVARTLEYAYDDWCILQIAKKLSLPKEEIAKWETRAMNYKNVFDKETKLMRGRNKNGSFQTPFSPYKWGDAFTEGNAWHYTWSVFHDIQGLINLMGGKKNFVSMLDSVFVVPPIYDDSYYGFCIHEIKEMQIVDMGNYAHGNQPAQHMLYLYAYAGEPWKTQEKVRETMTKLYSAQPDGYCGDEDNGQTSAWYVFSALGFYPVCPGAKDYVIGSPLFPKAEIFLDNGNKIEIIAKNNNSKTLYINKLKLNNKEWPNNYIDYITLKKGAKLDFIMSDKANYNRGIFAENSPYSFSKK